MAILEATYSKKLEGNAGLQLMVAPRRRVLASCSYAAGSLVLLPQTCNLVIQQKDKETVALRTGAVRTSVCLPGGREVWVHPQISLPGSKKKDTEEEEQKEKDKAFCALFWALRLVHKDELEEAQVPLEELEVTVASRGIVVLRDEEDETPQDPKLDFVKVPILINREDVQAGDELVRIKKVADVVKPAKPLKIKASSISGQPKKKKAKTVEVDNA